MGHEGCWHLTLIGARFPFGCTDKVKYSSWVHWKLRLKVLRSHGLLYLIKGRGDKMMALVDKKPHHSGKLTMGTCVLKP